MAVNLHVSYVAANLQAAALALAAAGGSLVIYQGIQPATPETSPGSNVLAAFALPSPAFGAPGFPIARTNEYAPDAFFGGGENTFT